MIVDISKMLTPELLEVYEKNEEWIKANPDYKVDYPKGDIILEDQQEKLIENPDFKPVKLTEERDEKLIGKPVKLVEEKVI
jgi:hypothetical protein